MDPAAYLHVAAQAMQADGSTVSQVQLPGGVAMVGYQGQFKVRWMATKLHLFTVMVPVPVATVDALQSLTRDSLEYAKATKGKLRGLQTGVATIPVLVAPQVAPDAAALVQMPPPKQFAAFTLPGIVDLGARQVLSYQATPFIGWIYAAWMRKRLAAACPIPA